MGMREIWELLDGKILEWDLTFRWEWEWKWNGNGNKVIRMGGNLWTRTMLRIKLPSIT